MTEKKSKQYFTVKIEATVPATLTYKILAETPEEALKLCKTPSGIKYHIALMRRLQAKIYNHLTTTLRLTKKL